MKERMKTYLDSLELELLEQAATSLLIRLLSHLGYRRSEALALKVDNIDFAQHTVTIQHLKSRLRRICPHYSARLEMSHIFCPKCGGKVDTYKTLSQCQTFEPGGMQS